MYSPSELIEITSEISVKKVNRSFLKVLVSSILAGMFIGLGYYTYIIIAGGNAVVIENAGLNKFLGASIFTVGIAMVLIAGADLFTGNCLVTVGAIDKKFKPYKVLTHLLIVLLGNLIGGVLIAVAIYLTKMETEPILNFLEELTTRKMNLNFFRAILSGTLANILVAIAVYMSYAAKDVTGKMFAAGVPVLAFVILGYEHSVANMFLLPYSFLHGNINSVIDIIFKNLIPVIIGNFIGGGIILPFAYYYLYGKKNKNNEENV